jgi:hypothetical protein
MAQEFHATYEHGILRLDAPLPLAELTRVTGLVTDVERAAGACPSPLSDLSEAHLSEAEFEHLLDEWAADAPPLPPDFCHADTYLHHD